MVVFADYEGLGVAIAKLLWLALTAPAALLALGGIVAGTLQQPRRKLAFWLGTGACVVELIGIAIVCLAFADEQARLGEYAERFRPGPTFWLISALTISAGLYAAYVGFSRGRLLRNGTGSEPRGE